MFYQVPLRHHLMSPFMRIPINGIFQFFPFRSTDFRTDHNIDPVDIFNQLDGYYPVYIWKVIELAFTSLSPRYPPSFQIYTG